MWAVRSTLYIAHSATFNAILVHHDQYIGSTFLSGVLVRCYSCQVLLSGVILVRCSCSPVGQYFVVEGALVHSAAARFSVLTGLKCWNRQNITLLNLDYTCITYLIQSAWTAIFLSRLYLNSFIQINRYL